MLDVLQTEVCLLLLLVDLLVVKEILWQEAEDLVAILLPELYSYLDSLASEESILAVPHGHVLCIKHNKWLLTMHQRLTRLIFSIDLSEQVVHTILSFYNILAFALFLLSWLINPVAFVYDVSTSALESLKRVPETEASNEVLFVRLALLASAKLLLILKVRAKRQESYQVVLFKQKSAAHQFEKVQLSLSLAFLLL